MEAMSKKEKLARGSAVIKVMRVSPRPGGYLSTYIDPRKLPKGPGLGLKGVLADMPWLDVASANFTFSPKSAKIPGQKPRALMDHDCEVDYDGDIDPTMIGLPEGDKRMKMFDYREWVKSVNPLRESNIAVHFNVLVGLLISMAMDPKNTNFADVEAFPCVQFLRTITTETGELPYNVSVLINYIKFVCQKVLDEG